MKPNQQINHRNRINLYYKYLLQKVENDEPFSYFKVLQPEASSLSPQKSNTKVLDPRTISLSDKKTPRYHNQLLETTPVKLPPIHRKESPKKLSSTIERQDSTVGMDWQKYYNVHNLSTVNIDESTIRLIEQNQRRSKAKKGSSISEQKNV